jgi:hypothetical protein
VRGRLPVLTFHGDTLTNFIRTNPGAMLAALLAEANDGILLLLEQSGAHPDRIRDLYAGPVVALVAQYLDEKRGRVVDESFKQNLERGLSGIEEQVRAQVLRSHEALEKAKEASGTLQGLTSQLEKTRTELESAHGAAIEDLRKSHTVILQEFESQWEKFRSKAQEQITAARALARDEATLEKATRIWSRKLRFHRTVFGIGLALLLILLTLGLFYIPDAWTAIEPRVPRNATQDIPYGFLLIMLIPVVAAAWVARIFVRWITGAMLLADDAEQRRAMLETYFRLVADPEAKMEVGDRILVLNAIFRPLPGHQTEDIAPPTLADLLKDKLAGK